MTEIHTRRRIALLDNSPRTTHSKRNYNNELFKILSLLLVVLAVVVGGAVIAVIFTV